MAFASLTMQFLDFVRVLFFLFFVLVVVVVAAAVVCRCTFSLGSSCWNLFSIFLLSLLILCSIGFN